MTTLSADLLRPLPDPADGPRTLRTGLSRVDTAFRGLTTTVGMTVFVITGAIGLFLGYKLIPTLHHYGLKFFTEQEFNPERNKVGISATIVGTVEVAVVAIIVSFPLALATALYITQYAPRWLKSTLVAVVDLMAAVPSIVYGLWGFFLLQKHAIYVSRFLHQYFGWLPFFKVDTDPNAAAWSQSRYTSSAFIAGLVVAMMVIPIAAAVMRGVFDQAPPGEREAAYALGATRWGMVRSVVLPFGRSGVIGGTMLGLGRALGETVAVLLIISPAYHINIRVLQVGTQTTSALIASRFEEASKSQLSALLAAGFVLFLMTLVVNTIAGYIVSRSRSGAMTEI